ncbi:MAG: LptF/LptG family permease, partial [Alphaproteobacteria bacterium]
IFSSPASGLTIYVKGVVNNQYQGILIHDARKDTAVTMMAEKGELEKTSSGPKLILYNGSRQEVKLESKEFSLLKFERYLFDLNDFQNKNNLIRTKQPDEKYLGGLLKDAFGFSTIEGKPKSNSRARAIAEAFHRLTWPLYCIILTLLATLPFFHSLYTRGGFGRAILINSIIAFLLIIFAFIMKNSAGKGLFIALFFVLLVIMQYLVVRRLALRENTIG